MSFRKVVFWLHLLAGVIAGVVILIMSVTGAMLAFEKDIIAWAERDVRRITPPTAGAKRIPLDDLLSRIYEKKPGERPSGITIDADPGIAVLFSFGRTNALYANPFSGEVREQDAPGTRAFMQTMIEWHRYLGGHNERRALGKAITGACNTAFLFLGVSGLYLWWPRQWTKNAFRSVALMNFQLRGKPRDWNWHNAIGFWCAPVLIVLTATALPISYQWAGNLIYKLTGTTAPAAGPGAAPAVEVPTPPLGAKRLDLDALFAVAQKELPQQKQITLRGAGPAGRGQSSGESRGTPPAITLTIVEKDTWPLFANTQLTLDPFTGAVLRKEGYSDFNRGRQVRSWTRFLHTGEALGTAGKAVAGLASAGAALLVWTGFSLAWRRFFLRDSGGNGPLPPPALQTAAKE